jgi:hypothetical protein
LRIPSLKALKIIILILSCVPAAFIAGAGRLTLALLVGLYVMANYLWALLSIVAARRIRMRMEAEDT